MFDLRWVFYFEGGKVQAGMWNWVDARDPLSNPNLMDTEGLLEAQIHRRERGGNGEIKKICGCEGQGFEAFEFLMEYHARAGYQRMIGIRLKTSEGSVACYIDGTVNKEG